MLKIDYFYQCMEKELYKERDWLLKCFAIIPRATTEFKAPYIPYTVNEEAFFQNEDGEEFKIDDFEFRKNPIFKFRETVDVDHVKFTAFDEDQKSSYGNMVVGTCVFIYALGGKIPFANLEGGLTIDFLDKIISEAVEEDRLDIDNDYKKYIEALDHLNVLTDFIVPTGSKKMFLSNKKVLELRDKLLKEYKGQLHKPEVAAMIEGELTKLDKELLADDPAAKGYLSNKLINTVRKKMFYVGGVTADIEDPNKVSFIESSLEEGWTAEDLPVMVNANRSGSYSRGALTADSGVIAKIIQRYLLNAKVGSDDCGTKIGLRVFIDKHNIEDYSGRYSAATGTLAKLSVGKEYILRDPGACKEPGDNVCKKCVGDRVANSGASFAGLGSNLGGAFMGLKLSAFHSKDISLQKLNLKNRLR